MTTFTDEQVAFIERLIDKRLMQQSLAAARLQLNTSRDYHTIPEIRILILEHLDEFRELVGDSPFPISLLRFFLSKKVQLRCGDSEVLPGEKNDLSRFDNQVANAIRASDWPECPFRNSSKRGSYEFASSPK